MWAKKNVRLIVMIAPDSNVFGIELNFSLFSFFFSVCSVFPSLFSSSSSSFSSLFLFQRVAWHDSWDSVQGVCQTRPPITRPWQRHKARASVPGSPTNQKPAQECLLPAPAPSEVRWRHIKGQAAREVGGQVTANTASRTS